MDDIKVRVANNLKYYRRLKKVTQKQLAEFLGIKDNTISTWETGINSIDIAMLMKICDYLHISINDIYGIHGNDDPNLTIEETELINKYRKLPREVQTYIMGMIDIKLQDCKNETTAAIDDYDIRRA